MGQSPERVIRNDDVVNAIETDVWELYVFIYGKFQFMPIYQEVDRRLPKQIRVTTDLRIAFPNGGVSEPLTQEALHDIMKEIGCTFEYIDPKMGL